MTVLIPGRLPLRDVVALESYINDDGTCACEITLRSHSHVILSGFTGRIVIVKE